MPSHLDLILVRHAAPDCPRGTFLGRTDPPLNEQGLAQVAATVPVIDELLAGRSVAALHVSPLRRAQQSGEPLARHLGQTLQTEPRLCEIDFGTWDGLTATQIRATGDEPQAWFDDPVTVRPGGGESFRDVRARLEPFLAPVLAAPPEGVVIVVAHFGVICNLAALALGLPVGAADRFRLARGQVGRIHHGILSAWGLPLMPPADRSVYGDRRAARTATSDA